MKLTKAQKRRALAATRYDRRWFNVPFLATPHHARVVQEGHPPAVVAGVGGRRHRRRRAAVERRERAREMAASVAAYVAWQENDEDIPF